MNIAVADIADIEELTYVEIESKLHSFITNEDYAIDHDKCLYRWQTYFAGQSPASSKPERIVLKSVENGKITGYIAVHLTSRYDMDAEIQSFYVLSNEQRKGTGSKLLHQALKWLAEFHAKSLCVGLFPENPYRAFYLKYGGQYLNPHWVYWNDLKLLKHKLTQSLIQ